MRSITPQAAMASSTRTLRQQQRGLSKLPLLVVLVVLAIMAALAAPYLINAFKHAHNPEIMTAEQDIDAIRAGLQQYKKHIGSYPTSEQGLLALIIKPSRAPIPVHWQTGGYLDRLPRDPWGHPYQYRVSEDGQQIDVFSFGAAGPAAGDDSTLLVRGSKH